MRQWILLPLTAWTLMLLAQGCNCEEEKREFWLKPKYQIYFESPHVKKPVPLYHVKAQCGIPDYILSPVEFKSRMRCDGTLCDDNIRNFVEPYLRAKDIEVGHTPINYGNYRFNENCKLWLYDESLHFEKPYEPGLFTMCAYTGFTCFCFYIENESVIAVATIHHWNGLETVDAIQQ